MLLGLSAPPKLHMLVTIIHLRSKYRNRRIVFMSHRKRSGSSSTEYCRCESTAISERNEAELLRSRRHVRREPALTIDNAQLPLVCGNSSLWPISIRATTSAARCTRLWLAFRIPLPHEIQ